MQRRLNSTQLDLETERARNRMADVQTRHLEAQLVDLRRMNSEQERMMKNRQVEYELLQSEVRTLADSAAASAASAAQAKAYKALVVPGYPVRSPFLPPSGFSFIFSFFFLGSRGSDWRFGGRVVQV